MKYAMLFALLVSSDIVTGCRSVDPVDAVFGAGTMIIELSHIDDTPREYVAWIDGMIVQNTRWCRHDERSACERAVELSREKAQFLKTGTRGEI